MNKSQLSRRQFNTLCAVGLSLPVGGGIASVLAEDAPARTVKLQNGAIIPAIGQASGGLGQGRHPETVEEEALRTGLSLGMSLIDTSGNYGDGRSEKLIGRAIAGQRDRGSWSPKWKPTKCLEMEWRVLVKLVSLASVPTLSISICCIGQCQILNSTKL